MDFSHQLAELHSIMYAAATLMQARIELEAMLTANTECAMRGEMPLYKDDQIMELINKHGIHHNGILAMLHPGRY